MTYEIVQRVGTIEYTVRGPDHLAVADLLRRARALVEDVSEADAAFAKVRMCATQEDRNEDFYKRQWRQHMDDLCAAMEIVQENSEFFDARVGDDTIKIIGDFFTRWATEKLADSKANRQALADEMVALTTRRFTIWHGGEQPAETKGKRVLVHFRSGLASTREADDSIWHHEPGSADIIGYRVQA